MSKILLIEPHRVLQQALALSLFPEHDVRVEESAGAGVLGGLKDVDLLIIDAAALRTAGKLTSELQRAVEEAKTPTLWIDDDDAGPKRAKLAALAPPIASGSLQTAVADLLSGESKKTKKNSRQETAGAIETAEEAAAEPIDLVEVVEDESQDKAQ
ncbi:MAG TPA: hypothetical protein VGH16_00195 [Candidatus Binatia bacterium]|jgi:hypothetical protein